MRAADALRWCALEDLSLRRTLTAQTARDFVALRGALAGSDPRRAEDLERKLRERAEGAQFPQRHEAGKRLRAYLVRRTLDRS